jgi:hypothetical protein
LGICVGLDIHDGTSAFGVGTPKSERPSSPEREGPCAGGEADEEGGNREGAWEAKQRPTPNGRDPWFCQPNQIVVFGLHQQ